jgi:hypothetical protein
MKRPGETKAKKPTGPTRVSRREPSDRPAPIALIAWKENVADTLRLHSNLSSERLAAAVEETLASCHQYRNEDIVGQASKADPPLPTAPDELKTKLRRLRTTADVLSSLLEEHDGKAGIIGELSSLLILKQIRDAETLDWSGELPLGGGQALPDAIKLSWLLVNELAEEVIRIGKKLPAEERLVTGDNDADADANRIVHKPPRMVESPRRAHVRRLMIIFTRIQGADLKNVEIGNPSERNDHGKLRNPLLRYLEAANVDVVGAEERKSHQWISPHTFASDAMEIREAARLPARRPRRRAGY